MVALRTLRTHGLPSVQLEEVTRAASAWWGFASEGDRGRVERFIGRLRRSGYLPKEEPTASEIVNEAEACLFRSVSCDSRHVLNKKKQGFYYKSFICKVNLGQGQIWGQGQILGQCQIWDKGQIWG